MSLAYKRILLKISGEYLAGSKKMGIDDETIFKLGETTKKLTDLGLEVAIVVGGGNFWRGRSSEHLDRVTADHMGMLATTMNGLALADGIDRAGGDTRVMSAITMRQISELYIRKRAIRHMQKGRVVVFTGGTGNPFFSTDSAAALRASEIGADIVLKATLVDGVYDKDPNSFPDAIKFDELSYDDVLQKKLNVMDATAAALCRDNKMPIAVFNINNLDNIIRVAQGESIGTLIH